MARPRAAENPRSKSKTAVIEEITRGVTKFSEILAAIDDCNKEGFPYRDGARAKAELQLREAIRRVFGERSPEFHAHRHHKLRISTPAETKQSIALIKSLIESLEQKKLELQGIAQPAPAPEPEAVSPQTRSQMTLAPPTTAPSAPVTLSQPTAALAASITTPAAMPTHAGLPPSSEPLPTPPPPQPLPAAPPPLPASKPAASNPVPPAHLTTSEIRAVPPAIQTPASVPSAQPTPAPPSAPIPTPAQQPEPSALTASPSPTPPTRTIPDITPAMSAQTAPPPSIPDASANTAWASATGSVARQSFQATRPAVPPNLPGLTPTAPPAQAPPVETSAEADPLDTLRKVCTRFHAVAQQLRLRKDYRTTLEVEDDYDLQDLLCALLKLEFEEVGSDEWTPPYTGGSPRTTFLINTDRTAVIAKKTRPGLTVKELAEQVSADAQQYAARARCTSLFCFIYDPEGRIGSPKRLETDLTSVSDRYTVEVLVAPK